MLPVFVFLPGFGWFVGLVVFGYDFVAVGLAGIGPGLVVFDHSVEGVGLVF